MFSHHVNPLPNGKILDVTKLKAFAVDKLKFVKMTISLLVTVENTVGKGDNAVFLNAFFFQVIKSQLVW